MTTAVVQQTAASPRELHLRVSSRADSTPAALDDDTFAAGLGALARDAAAGTTPVPVVDHLDLTVLRRARDRDVDGQPRPHRPAGWPRGGG